MKELIEALNILLKYGNSYYPTTCGRDVLMICDIDPDKVSQEDVEKLYSLGFFISEEYGEPMFKSYKYGRRLI